MKTKTLHLKPSDRTSWFARLTGASPEILDKCSSACRNAFDYAGMILIFTPLLSAAVISFAIAHYSFKDMSIYPLIFSVWLIFIYLFDRLVIMSNNDITKWVRFFAIIVLALFHSFVWDTLTLKDDILAQIRKEYNAQVVTINEKYDDMIAPVQNSIDSIQNKNLLINSHKRSYLDSLQAEGRGFGGSGRYGVAIVYENLVKVKDEYVEMAANDVETNNAVIIGLNSHINTINERRFSEISQIVKPGEAGLMEQVKQMHQLVFIHGSTTEKIFFLIWFGIFCFVESLPVIVKVVFHDKFKEYFIAQEGEQENSIKAFRARKSNDWTILLAEMAYDTELRMSKVTSDSFLKKIELSKQGIHERLRILDVFLSELAGIDSELRKMYPSNYYEFVKPEIEKAQAEFAKAMNINS